MTISCYSGELIEVQASSLEGFNFDGMNLHRADLADKLLTGAIFVRANLSGAILIGAEAQRANFT